MIFVIKDVSYSEEKTLKMIEIVWNIGLTWIKDDGPKEEL